MMRTRGSSTSRPSRPQLRTTHYEEPVLEFAGARQHVDQKTGLSVFGPASLGTKRHPARIRLGFVGSGRSIESAQDWFYRAVKGIQGVESEGLMHFPGCAPDRGFFTELLYNPAPVATITRHELSDFAVPKLRKERFAAALQLVSDRVRLLSQQDDPPDCVILALPDEMLELAKTVDYRDPKLGKVHRDFRRALKAELMRHKLPTQILLQRTSEAEPDARNVDHPSRVAWNLLTSLFYKGKGLPWRPVGLEASTCYIGISFFRPLAAETGTLRSAVAQAFDQDGNGLVLRGPDFTWNEQKDGKSPHLTDNQAEDLLKLVLRRYKEETDQLPSRVVVHKTSRFFPAELEGFRKALREVPRFDLVSVSPTSEIRLLREGKYPPLRGTLFEVGLMSYLYTTGYISALDTYPHGHVPSALQIADHHGDSFIRQIVSEILALTKMNWNSAGFAGTFPITIRFSRLVGDILREIPDGREPEPNFKYYT
jgi:hypothetical protein